MGRTIVYHTRAVLLGLIAGAMWSGNSFSRGMLIGVLAFTIVNEIRDTASSLAAKLSKEGE